MRVTIPWVVSQIAKQQQQLIQQQHKINLLQQQIQVSYNTRALSLALSLSHTNKPKNQMKACLMSRNVAAILLECSQ